MQRETDVINEEKWSEILQACDAAKHRCLLTNPQSRFMNDRMCGDRPQGKHSFLWPFPAFSHFTHPAVFHIALMPRPARASSRATSRRHPRQGADSPTSSAVGLRIRTAVS